MSNQDDNGFAGLLAAKIETVIQAKIDDGSLDKMIEEKVSKTLDSILTDMLRDWSPFGKALKESLESALAVDLNAGGLGGYNARVIEIVRAQLNAKIEGTWADALSAKLAEMLADAPASIKVSDLLRKLIEEYEEDARGSGWETATCNVHVSEYGSTWLYLSPEGKTENYEMMYSILLNDDGTAASVRVRGKTQEAVLAGSLYGFERVLYQLENCGTVIELDWNAGEHEECYDWVP